MGRPGSVNLYSICRSVGIKLRNAKGYSLTSHRPRTCFCGSTLRSIGLEHGEAHLALTLKLVVESKGNECALLASIVHSVSNVIASGRVTVDGALFEKFDTINLEELRRWSSKARIGRRQGTVEVMTTSLLWILAPPEAAQRPRHAHTAPSDESTATTADIAQRAPVSLSVAKTGPQRPRKPGWALTRILEAA